MKGDVTGALIDTYVLGRRKDLFEKPSLRIIDIYDYSTAYGVALGRQSRKLMRCFGRYVQSHRKKIFQTVEKHVDLVEVRKETTGLFVKSRLSMIVRVNVVLNRTVVVDSD